MDSRRGQPREGRGKPSILGNGLLERARSTSLALLGLTAAVGLGMVALALNQGWPLIEGAPIPGVGAKRQAVGTAIVAAPPKALDAALLGGASGSQGAGAPAGSKGNGSAGSQPAPEGLVVSVATPVSSPPNGPPGKASPGPAPVEHQPAAPPAPAQATTTPAAPSAATETPVSSTSPPSSPAPTPSSAPPPETPEEPVEDEDGEEDEGSPPEEWGGHDHDHDHGYGHGRGHWGR